MDQPDYYNHLFRSISVSHRMTKHDVAAACRAGGMEVSTSRAEGWRRAWRGGHLERGERRAVSMTREEFEAFCLGLPDWSKTVYDDAGR